MSASNNLVDQPFGKLIVIAEAPVLNQKSRSRVRCECGREKEVYNYNLKSGKTTACGFCRPRESLVGRVFGRLTVLQDVEPKGDIPAWRSLCRCECPEHRLVTVPNSALKSGNTQSCGCLQAERQRASITKHGHTSREHGKSRTYQSWHDMKTRCMNPNATGYENYGGRGITVCERWQDFTNFLADMGECPPRLTIERIGNNGNYEPGNCYWASMQAQMINKRTNRVVTYRGITGCVKEVCRAFDIPYERVKTRLKRGWGVEAAFSTPDIQGVKSHGLALTPAAG